MKRIRKAAPSNRLPVIVDEYGELDAQIKALEFQRKVLRAEIIELSKGQIEVYGASYRIHLNASERWTIDQAKVRAKLGEAWCTANSKVTSVISLHAKPIQAIEQAA